MAARQRRNGRPLADDPDFCRAPGAGGDRAGQHAHHQPARGGRRRGGAPGAESSMLKIRGTQIRQEITALNRRAMGPMPGSATADAHGADTPIGPDGADTASAQYFNNRKLSIFGGSNEIQKTSSPR